MIEITFLADRHVDLSGFHGLVLLEITVIVKAIAYHIQAHEKESLVLANGKRHDLTLISNGLNYQTVVYTAGKETVIVTEYDRLDRAMLEELWLHGVKRIITRSRSTAHIDLEVAHRMGYHVANLPASAQSMDEISAAIIRSLDCWSQGQCVGEGCRCGKVNQQKIKTIL